MPRAKKDTAADIESRLTAEAPRTHPISDDAWLSSGITVLNLATSGRPDGLIPKGRYLYLVGDSDSGKSFLAFALFAEAARNPHFAKHRLIFDNAERGALMDVTKFFGTTTAERVEPPRGTRAEPEYSTTVQEMFYNLDRALDHKQPCIHVVDSVDAVGANEDDAHFEEEKKAFEDDKDVPGSYGMAKPKYISRHINRVSQRLDQTGSIGVFISQTRDKVGGTIPGQRTRAGGRAIKFFSRLELWTAEKEEIRRTVLGKDRKVGSIIEVDVRKNHLTGWRGKVLIPFYPSLGFDDTECSVRFLTDEGVFTKTKSTLTAPEFDFEGTQEKLITKIESDDTLVTKLKEVVTARWAEIRAASAVTRKPRY